MRASKVAVLVPEADVRVARDSTRAEITPPCWIVRFGYQSRAPNHSYFRS